MKKYAGLILVVTFGLVGCASSNNKKEDESATASENSAESNQKSSNDADKKNQKLQSRIDELEKQLEAERSLVKRQKELRGKLEEELASLVDGGKVKLTTRRGLLVVQMPEEILFASGKFEISDKGKSALKSVASATGNLKKHHIFVAGHTDNVPVSKKSVDFSDNWELSTKRALSAAKVLKKAGVSADRLAAAGFGPNDPIAKNNSDQNRAKNRRVELLLVPNLSKVLERAKALDSMEGNEEREADNESNKGDSDDDQQDT